MFLVIRSSGWGDIAAPCLHCLAFALALIGLTGGESTQSAQAAKPEKGPTRIALIGDSTVADQSGWGPAFARRLSDGVECRNFALGGRSSKSYYEKGPWKQVLASKPDYILIQFGHNDQPGKGPDRETDPKTTYPQFLTRFIDEARAAGAAPILVTSMTRRRFSREGRIISDLGPYVEAVKRLGKERNVQVIDLHARSIAFLNELGPQKAEVLNPTGKGGAPDRTHLTPKGAAMMADLVVHELVQVVPTLKRDVK